MTKEIPKTKAKFAAMLMRDYGYSEKLSNDCASIVAGYGAFDKKSWNGKKSCTQRIKRMPYHKENNPTCKLPAIEGCNYCRRHALLHSKNVAID